MNKLLPVLKKTLSHIRVENKKRLKKKEECVMRVLKLGYVEDGKWSDSNAHYDTKY